ncbi:MAG: helix-turn-helix domain-containing protein [Actinomycetota bacterium]|nr:helix-turn-helix domain-containing protein [Actinomycetota bacterium]
MKTKAALGEFIRTQRRGAQLSLRAMSKLAGVSLPYLSQIERGLRRPSAEILQAIAKALRISSQTLYVQAGILEEQPRADVVAAVMGDPGLTERQKQALIAVYHSFRDETDRRRASRKQVLPEQQAAAPPAVAAPSAEVIPISIDVRSGSARTRSRNRASGRAETQADPKPSPGSPSPSRSPSSRATTKGGAR